MQQYKYKVFIYTALPCEAKPLVDFFCLKKQMSVTAFAVYANQNICLTVTGCGKAAMAAGIAYTQALSAQDRRPVMLNIGIAGHPEHFLGEVFLIEKITDADSGKSYYPPLVFTPPCGTENIQTASKPQLAYLLPCLYDMEVSAFYETATRFAYAELIHSLKVVSDNKTSPADMIHPKQVSELIAAQMGTINDVISALIMLAEQLPVTAHQQFAQLISRYRFTAAEKQLLAKQLSRYTLLTGNQSVDIDGRQFPSGKALLGWLQQQIDESEVLL